MALKSLSFFACLALVIPTTIAAAAPPTKRASCKNGRTAQHEECCVWYDVLDDVQNKLFSGGQCDETAHDALRLTFHDAIGFSQSLIDQGKFGGGGADGSIMKFQAIEFSFPGNEGLESITIEEEPIAERHNVSFGDMIQFAGAVGVRNCAGGPRLEFLAGRPDAQAASPLDLLPDAADSVDKILARMADGGGFSADELVDLLASHSIGFQEHIDETIEFTPFDSSVMELDSQFFLETLLEGVLIPGDGLHSGQALSPIPGAFRLASDEAIARDERTSCRWQKYISEQELMAANFKKAMAKMAIVGQDRSKLVDCSDVIPAPEKPLPSKAKLPPGKTVDDVEWSCDSEPRPKLEQEPAPEVELERAFSG